MTKEEANIDDLANHYGWTAREKERVLEYAKQQCIEFLKYWNYECVGYPIEDNDEETFSKTYNDFLTNQSK